MSGFGSEANLGARGATGANAQALRAACNLGYLCGKTLYRVPGANENIGWVRIYFAGLRRLLVLRTASHSSSGVHQNFGC
jgi:hypothetical protein